MGRTGSLPTGLILALILMSVVVIAFIVFMERAQRRVVVQYPKRQVGTKMFGGEASHLPLKLSTSGVKMTVQVVVATTNCEASEHQDKFGCHKGLEIVAGGNGLDSCNGDSGGPAYILLNGKRMLAGATSRATRNFTRPCGDGGIYTRVDKYLDWIKTNAEANGGELAE